MQRLRLEWPLLLLFFASGIAGLIYQSVWSSYLGTLLGHAAYAQTLVLMIFMGGMGVGAWLVGRRVERMRDPLLAYAIVELAIGALGLVFHPLFVAAHDWTLASVLPATESVALSNTFKWSLAALLILPQSIMLGTTFPLMSTGYMRRRETGDGRALAGLYFSNSAGAAFGALLAAFALMPAVGLPGALVVAGALNILVALGSAVAARATRATPPVVYPPSPEAREAGLTPLRRFVLMAAAITGASSFVYEVGWVRMLNLALGSSVHAFELMLSAFIGGIALGGLAIRRRIDSDRDPLRTVGYVQVGMGLAALLSIPLYSNAFEWVGWLMNVLSRSDQAYALFNIGSSAVAILIMMPAAFFAGMTLPLFTVALLRGGWGERSVGGVYAANTIGSIIGVLAAVHLLIPVIGLRLSVILAALADILLGLAILRWHATRVSLRAYAVTGLVAMTAVALCTALVQFDPLRMASGVFRTGVTRLSENHRVIYQRDGKTATVALAVGPGGTAFISTNGKPDASIALADDQPPTADEYTMALAAMLPLAAHADPRRIGVIGFGSGMTTHTFLGDPRVEVVDTIEIEPAMVAGARGFGTHVERAFDDPRSRIVIEDAKTFFPTRGAVYDIVVSEPSNPWVHGVAGLFSEEFYRFLPQHLAEGGLLVQWLQLYEIDEALVVSMLKALSCCFRDFDIYSSNGTDILILASLDARDISLRHPVLEARGMQALAQRLGLSTLDDLRLRWIGNRTSMQPLMAMYDIRANSDYYPVVAYAAPRTRFRSLRATSVAELVRFPVPTVAVLTGHAWPDTERPPIGREPGAARALRGARALHAAITGSSAATDLGELDEVARRAHYALRGQVAECPPMIDGRLLRADLTVLSEALMPYLTAPQLGEVWQAEAWRRCDSVRTEIEGMLAFLHGLGTRDHAAAKAAGLRLLERLDVEREPVVAQFALTGAMLAALALGETTEVERLYAQAASALPPSQAWDFHRSYLLAASDLGLGRPGASP